MNQSKLPTYLPWIAVGLTLLYFGYRAMPPREAADEFHYRKFGMLPVLEDGRYKPMDTYARNTLMIITSRQQYYDYKSREYRPANQWLLDFMTSPPANDQIMARICANGAQMRPGWDYKVFRIDNEELVRDLDLKWREGHSYSIDELNGKDKLDYLESQRARIDRIPPKERTLLDTKTAELIQHLQLCMAIAAGHSPHVIPDTSPGGKWSAFSVGLMEHVERKQAGEAEPAAVEDAVAFYYDLLRHYDSGDKRAFNRALDDYLAKLDQTNPALMTRMRTEVFFNEFAPFYRCLEVYVVLGLLICVSWLWPVWGQPLRKGAFAAMGLVFLVHTGGLVLRMYLQDRPLVFVTNLYSSAVFIGWGCILVCLIEEWIYGNGIATLVGSVTGFASLIIAHILSLDGDTMIMMQAVLDTNFWLATHVTCVTLGYTAAFYAGGLGIWYIFSGVFTDRLRGEGSANLARMIYGVLCFGMFLSFVGTVLGGLWADYSWGRFWGWDPKENGALLIVLWIALILHARWGGMVKHRGVAVLSVLGIIVTSWSWFGTNFLGIGLHAYGGAKANAMLALILIDVGFLAIAGLGMMPLEMWQSFRPAPAPTPLPKESAKARAMVGR